MWKYILSGMKFLLNNSDELYFVVTLIQYPQDLESI